MLPHSSVSQASVSHSSANATLPSSSSSPSPSLQNDTHMQSEKISDEKLHLHHKNQQRNHQGNEHGEEEEEDDGDAFFLQEQEKKIDQAMRSLMLLDLKAIREQLDRDMQHHSQELEGMINATAPNSLSNSLEYEDPPLRTNPTRQSTPQVVESSRSVTKDKI